MSKFHELVNQIKQPGDDGVPDTIYDDLIREHDTVFEGYTHTTQQQQQAIAERDAEIARLKGANYDLLMSVGTGSKPEDQQDNEQEKPISLDDLFTK